MREYWRWKQMNVRHRNKNSRQSDANQSSSSAGQISGNASWALDSSLEDSTAVEAATTISAIKHVNKLIAAVQQSISCGLDSPSELQLSQKLSCKWQHSSICYNYVIINALHDLLTRKQPAASPLDHKQHLSMCQAPGKYTKHWTSHRVDCIGSGIENEW